MAQNGISSSNAQLMEALEKVDAAAAEIRGQETGIESSTSDVLEISLLTAAGVKLQADTVHDIGMRFSESSRNPSIMFIDYGRLSDQDANKLVDYINEEMGYHAAANTGEYDGWQHSIQVDIDAIQQLAPQIDNALETLGANNPDMIHFMQHQSFVRPENMFDVKEQSQQTRTLDNNMEHHI